MNKIKQKICEPKVFPKKKKNLDFQFITAESNNKILWYPTATILLCRHNMLLSTSEIYLNLHLKGEETFLKMIIVIPIKRVYSNNQCEKNAEY